MKPHPFIGRTKKSRCYHCGHRRMNMLHWRIVRKGRARG